MTEKFKARNGDQIKAVYWDRSEEAVDEMIEAFSSHAWLNFKPAGKRVDLEVLAYIGYRGDWAWVSVNNGDWVFCFEGDTDLLVMKDKRFCKLFKEVDNG